MDDMFFIQVIPFFFQMVYFKHWDLYNQLSFILLILNEHGSRIITLESIK
jgi:hypothetical protein